MEQQEELDKAIKEADAKAEKNPALPRLMAGLKAKVGGVRGYVKKQARIEVHGKNMLKAMEYSQWARNACIEVDSGVRTPQEFKTAKLIVERGIGFLDDAMNEFPKTIPAMMTLKTKMFDQLKMIEAVMKEQGVE